MVDNKLVKEWFDKGANDLNDAEFLFQHNRSFETIAFLIQQAAEKYLKGFLIAKGKELVKIHDLVKLLADAIEFVPELNRFEDMVERATEFYFETRYPMGYTVDYSRDEINEALEEVKKMLKIIRKHTNVKWERK